MTSSKILSRFSQHRQTQEWKENRWRGPCVCPLYSFVCIRQPRAALKLTSQPCRACDWKRDGRGSENVASIVLEWNCPSPSWSALTSPLSAHKVADACHHTEFVPKLPLTNSPARQESWQKVQRFHSWFTSGKWRYQVASCILPPQFWETCDAALISSRM